MLRERFEKVGMKRILFISFAIVSLLVTFDRYVCAEDFYDYEEFDQTEVVVETKNNTFDDTLNMVEEYQQKYFDIIKRNNVLLQMEDGCDLNNDRKELEDLFAQVQGQITNKKYLDKYNKIQKRFADCDAETTPDINECAEKNYKAIDNLLNSVYLKAKSKQSFDNYMNLAASKNKWLKEVTAYKKVYDSMDFGTIGTSVFYSYQINMKEFRALLMMLFL